MRTAALIAAVGLIAILAGCQSFSDPAPPSPPSQPTSRPAGEDSAARVGQGIHAWPVFESGPENGGWRTDLLWPFFAFQTDADGNLAYDRLFLLYNQERGKDRLSRYLIPVLFYDRRQDRLDLALLPVGGVNLKGQRGDGSWEEKAVQIGTFGWETSPDKRRVSVWPVYAREKGPGRDELKIWPLYVSDERTSATLSSPEGKKGGGAEETVKETDLLWPVFHWRTAPDGSRFEIRPFYFKGDTKTAKWTVLFPVFWNTRKDDKSFFALWPFYALDRDGSHRTDYVLHPFFSHGEDPERGLKEWDAFKPLFHYGKSNDGTTVRALPLLWHALSPDAQTTVLFPFWWDLRDKDSSFKSLFPLFGIQRKGEEFERRFHGGPFLVSTRDGERRAVDVLWPIFKKESGPDGWSFRGFPFLWAKRRAEEASFHLWPLYGAWSSPKKAGGYVLWPFFHRQESPQGWSLTAFPVVKIERGERGSSTTVFPLFHDERDAEQRSGWAGGPLVMWGQQEGEGGTFRVLFRLIKKKDSPEKSSLEVNPFFHYETNASGDVSWSALFGLISRTREGDESRGRLLWLIPWGTNPGNRD